MPEGDRGKRKTLAAILWGKHISLVIYVRDNTYHWETYVTVTPVPLHVDLLDFGVILGVRPCDIFLGLTSIALERAAHSNHTHWGISLTIAPGGINYGKGQSRRPEWAKPNRRGVAGRRVGRKLRLRVPPSSRFCEMRRKCKCEGAIYVAVKSNTF